MKPFSEPSFQNEVPCESSPPLFRNLVDLARQRADLSKNKNLYTFLTEGGVGEETLSYQDLDWKARKIAAVLQNLGRAGDRVILFFNPGLDYITAFFGCLYAGMIAVPSYPPKFSRNYQKIVTLFQDSGATIVLSYDAILANIKEFTEKDVFFKQFHWIDVNTVGEEWGSRWKEPAINSDDVAFLQYTSGSTSAPKGVMVTHGNLLSNLRVIYDSFGESEKSQGVIWLPPYHDMGLIGGILQPLFGNFPVVLMSPFSFLQKPLLWLSSISKYRATTSGGPNFAFELCIQKITDEQKKSLDLSSWSVAFNGAEPIHHETLDRFYEAFRSCGFRKEAFFPCYGLAESTLYVSGTVKGRTPVVLSVEPEALRARRVEAVSSGDAQVLVSSGRIFEGESLEIVDPETGIPSASDELGEVWVSSPSVAQGYWNQPELSRLAFGAYLGDRGPFLRTGDLGFLNEGELYIAGRLKDLIIVRGRNHYPQDIELTAEKSHESLSAKNGVAFSIEKDGEERLVVVFEIRRGAPPAPIETVFSAVKQQILENHDLQLHALALIKPMTLPKTTSGKVQRNLSRQKYLAGDFEVVGQFVEDGPLEENQKTHSPSEIVGPRIREALQNAQDGVEREILLNSFLVDLAVSALKIDRVVFNKNHPLNHYGFDSLMAVNFVHKIEMELGVIIPMETLLGGETLEGLTSQILIGWTTAMPVKPATGEAPSQFALSRNQQSLWFMNRLFSQSSAYNLNYAFSLPTDIDVGCLKKAFVHVIQENPSLRTTFRNGTSGPEQVIDSATPLLPDEVNVSGLSTTEYTSFLDELASIPFDLEKGPLFRLNLLKRAQGNFDLFISVHHIVSDFWSLSLFLREIGTAYSSLKAGKTLALSNRKKTYFDFVQKQSAQLETNPQVFEFWKQRLSGDLPLLNLETDFQRPPVQTFRGASHFIKLGQGFKNRLKTLSASEGTTVYTTLLAAFKVFLHKYTSQNDLLVGTLTAGRQSADFSDVMGYFVNPLVIRSDLAGNPSFKAFLAQMKQTVLQSFEHQTMPFDLLVERLQQKRDLSRSPLFQVLYVHQKSPFSESQNLAEVALNETSASIDFGDLRLASIPLRSQTAQFDLSLTTAEFADGLGVAFQYNTDLFKAETISRMMGHFANLLEGILGNPELAISEISLLGSEERQRMLFDWNHTETRYEPIAVHQLFEQQVRLTPDSPALLFHGETLTYAELNRKANRLARFLIDRGLKKEFPVAVCIERSASMVIGLLAALKAGGSYLPLDPTHPKERLVAILEDAVDGGTPPFVLTQEHLAPLFGSFHGDVFFIDTLRDEANRWPETNPEISVSPEQLAYTIYTSGSTGKPKGVQILHRSVANFLASMKNCPGCTPRDVLLSVTTISFDIAGLEIFLPLSCGAQVVLADEAEVLNPVALAKIIANQGVTIMQATPSLWKMLLDSGWSGKRFLKILCGGEAFPPELAIRLTETGAEVWNMYGPTETTIWSTVQRVDGKTQPGKAISIGRPIANTKIYIVDQFFQPVPIGVGGELCIGGDGVAKGYFNRPELTAEKFIPDPFDPSGKSRIYRTGDLARYRADGSIDFSGRLDHQVKIRGYRIEIGEIEAALKSHPEIQDALVVALDTPAGFKILAAYVIAQNAPGVSELHRHLKSTLPDYMIPSHFLFLEKFPQTPNGKIDRKALPKPEGRPELESSYQAPQGEVQEVLTKIWQETLKVDRIGVNDNFFELGGNSLLMVQIQAQVAAQYPDRAPGIVELFQYPTVSSLSQFLTDDGTKEADQQAQTDARIEARKARTGGLESLRESRKRNRLEF